MTINVKESAKELLLSWGRPQSEFKDVISNLLSELDRLEKIKCGEFSDYEEILSQKIAAPLIKRIEELTCQKNACHQVILESDSRIAELEKLFIKIRNVIANG